MIWNLEISILHLANNLTVRSPLRGFGTRGAAFSYNNIIPSGFQINLDLYKFSNPARGDIIIAGLIWK